MISGTVTGTHIMTNVFPAMLLVHKVAYGILAAEKTVDVGMLSVRVVLTISLLDAKPVTFLILNLFLTGVNVWMEVVEEIENKCVLCATLTVRHVPNTLIVIEIVLNVLTLRKHIQ